MQRKPPRYDLPNAAPEPLRQVQRYVNTIDLSHDREWLSAWLHDVGLPVSSDADLERARTLREAIRALPAGTWHGESRFDVPGGDVITLLAAVTIDTVTRRGSATAR